ncbi:trypsin-like peptidase domain-containing protein [Streptomyces alboniger]|nr:trypsin-like peptidase domain-containing protein [Streptomyces alboniger]
MHWRARIGTVDGVPAGAGVLVDRARLITCAHVVDGLGEVVVTLPGVAEALPATVAWTGGWRCQGDRGDLAVLELGEPLAVSPCAFAPLDVLRPREGRGTAELRALGFPFGHEKDGTHVTLRTSADRLLGQEWLEIDVEQAHLQRLGEGFSGAAVYDPGTNLVVGIVTDAVLSGDQEGYIGRMLPLDTIRGHWEDLDDFLPLDWLPDAPRRELRALFDGVRLDPGTLELAVRRAFPTFRRPLPAFRTAWHAIRYAGEELTGEDRLLRLLPELGAAAIVTVDPWLRRWMPDRYDDLAHAPAAPRPPSRPTGSVVFRAQPMTRGGAIDLSVSTVIDGVPVSRAGPVRVRRQQLRARTEALLAEQIGSVHGFDWMLEFVVPEGLMSEPFEEWQIREPGAARPRPMRTVPVVVRHLDRLEPLLASYLAVRRWATVRARGRTRPVRVECGLPYGYEEFHDWLDADEQLCALAYAATPDPNWLSAALDTGVPIMLWRRHDCGAGNHAHCAPEKFLDRITDAVADLDPARLPFEVMRLRKDARSPDKGDAEHCGHRLTLFWDGAESKPDPPLSAAHKAGTSDSGSGGSGTESTESTGSG